MEPVIYQNSKERVIIIGAGFAGIKAAHTLYEAGVDFVLVEYSDYIGGRVKNTQFNGRTVEEGANWIQGTTHQKTGKTNPVWQMA